MRRAGIANFRWHDLRHTWASWHVRSGTSLQELMEFGGWSSYEMVLRYAHLAGEYLKDATDWPILSRLRFESAIRLPARGGADLLGPGQPP